MRRLAERAAPMVRETPFPPVNRIAGERGRSRLARRKLDNMPDAADVVTRCSRLRPLRRNRRPRRSASARAAPKKKLDEALLPRQCRADSARKGQGRLRVRECHATHTLFNATWSTVMNVVDTANPKTA